jgi:hypothetical protein
MEAEDIYGRAGLRVSRFNVDDGFAFRSTESGPHFVGDSARMALVKFEKWEGMESDITIVCSQGTQVFV